MSNVLGRWVQDTTKRALLRTIAEKVAEAQNVEGVGYVTPRRQENVRYLQLLDAQVRILQHDDARLVALDVWHTQVSPGLCSPDEPWDASRYRPGLKQLQVLTSMGTVHLGNDNEPIPADEMLSQLVMGAMVDTVDSVNLRQKQLAEESQHERAAMRAELDAERATFDDQLRERDDEILAQAGELAAKDGLLKATLERVALLETSMDTAAPAKPKRQPAARAAA